MRKRAEEAPEAGEGPARSRRAGHDHNRGPVEGEGERQGARSRARSGRAKCPASLSIPPDLIEFSSMSRPITRRTTLSWAMSPTRDGCPSPGRETVLDALQFAGGLIHTARAEGHPPGPARAGQGSRRRSTRSIWRRSRTRATSPRITSSSPAIAWSWAATTWSRRRSSSIVSAAAAADGRQRDPSGVNHAAVAQDHQPRRTTTRSSRTWSSSGSRR